MERNSSTAGGDDSNSKDMIHEGGASDELTPPIAVRTGGLSRVSKA